MNDERTPPRFPRAAAIAAAMSLLSSVTGPMATRAATPTDLFISEYVEGSSSNKALELYNGTGTPVDLGAGAYAIDIYANGSPTVSVSLPLTGVLADGDVFVVANPGADPLILLQADQQSSVISFNGNDAVVLRRDVTTLDVIGQVGSDPGIEWGTDPTSTADNTLQRQPHIVAGDTNGADAFDPALEWIGFLLDTFDGLGTHAIASPAGTVSADITVAAAAACLELSVTAVSFGTLPFGAEDAPATPSVAVTNCATTDGTLLASGTNAAGTDAAWNLVDSAATCADTLGLDTYRLSLASADLPAPVGLSTTNKTVQTLAAGQSTTHTPHTYTACPGSTGDGQTLTLQINYLASE